MQITEVVSTVHSVLAAIKMGIPVWTAIGVLIVYGYVRRRSGSSNFLRERLWRILGGAGEFHDKGMDARWKRVTDFERYRYNSGIKFQRAEQITQFETWLESKNMGLEEVLPYARYYDIGNADLRDPDLRGHRRSTAYFSLLILFGIGLFSFFFYSDAQMKVKATGTYFWVSTTEARAAFVGSWKITPNDCDGDSADLNPQDRQVICELLTTTVGKEFIQSAKQTQAEVSAIVIAVSMVLLFKMFFSLGRTRDAHRLYSRSRAAEIPDSSEEAARGAEI